MNNIKFNIWIYKIKRGIKIEEKSLTSTDDLNKYYNITKRKKIQFYVLDEVIYKNQKEYYQVQMQGSDVIFPILKEYIDFTSIKTLIIRDDYPNIIKDTSSYISFILSDDDTENSLETLFSDLLKNEPKPQLTTPQNVTINKATVSWDEVQNAESYDIYVDNIIYENVKTTSYDLSTSTKWNNILDGEHIVQIIAKANNYRDSEKSTSITFIKNTILTPSNTLYPNSALLPKA